MDKAGNVNEVTTSFTVDTNPFSLSGPYDGIPLFILIILFLILLILFLLLWKKKKDEEEDSTAEQEKEPASGLSENTEEILRDLLNYDDEKIEDLKEKGAV